MIILCLHAHDNSHVIFLCPACWPPSHVNKSLHLTHFCAIVDCGRKNGKGEGVAKFRLPAIIYHKGKETEEVTREKNAMDFCDKPR